MSSNKKITKSSKQIKAEAKEKDSMCPECKKHTGMSVDTIIEKDRVVKKFKCRFPGCGCEYEIVEAHEGIVHIETGEDMWKSGGMQIL